MQDVGQHQFLVLLLMVEPDFQQRSQPGQCPVGGIMEEFHHRCVDVLPVGSDVVRAGPGKQAARIARLAGPGADIIGIEQERVVRMVRRVTRAMRAQQKLLEKPGGMGAVPLRRAGVRHRLHQLVLGR